MKKKIISLLLGASCVFGTAAFAEVIPKVVVDGCEVVFDDQQPVIEQDRTLVPLRGVMEAAGADVRWYPKQKLIQVQSHDDWRITEITIDSDILKASKFREDNILLSDTTEITLDIPARVVNDRTLIPIRAVAESFLYDVEWDDGSKTAYITTDRSMPDENGIGIYLSSDKEDVSAGDTVNVYINVKNFDGGDTFVINGVTAGLTYDKSKLELASADLFANGAVIGGVGASNPDFSEDSLKTSAVTVNYSECHGSDGAIYRLTFNVLADDGGSLALSKRYNSRLGYDTSIIISEGTDLETFTPVDMYVDTTPVVLK